MFSFFNISSESVVIRPWPPPLGKLPLELLIPLDVIRLVSLRFKFWIGTVIKRLYLWSTNLVASTNVIINKKFSPKQWTNGIVANSLMQMVFGFKPEMTRKFPTVNEEKKRDLMVSMVVFKIPENACLDLEPHRLTVISPPLRIISPPRFSQAVTTYEVSKRIKNSQKWIYWSDWWRDKKI